MNKIDQVVELFQSIITIKKVGELKQFLGFYMVWNQIKQTIWLLEKAYITKIYNKFAIEPTN